MGKPDILIFMSDQHNAMLTGFAGDRIVKTPNMDKLAADGTVFDAAYTSYPLCVPARISFMTGQYPLKNGYSGNSGAVGEDQATFIHSLGIEGYETVLCGRMHFFGADQRHGFLKRIAGDITPTYMGKSQPVDWGIYERTNNDQYFNTVGGGDSPVLAYDRMVIKAALDYLTAQKTANRSKPLCLVVGTYGPHSTYVAPAELYTQYLNLVPQPAAVEETINYDLELYKRRLEKKPAELIRKVRAAYYGMITTIDSQLGAVRGAWDDFLKEQNRKGIFVYTSDHGDQLGERNIYAKMTLFDGAAKIPLVFAGDGIKRGSRISQAVSLLDISPTVCELAGAEIPPDPDGQSLANQLVSGNEEIDRAVICECSLMRNETFHPGRMVRYGKWKYITYCGLEDYDLLFNMEKDPYELHNCLREEPAIAAELYAKIKDGWDVEDIKKKVSIIGRHAKLLRRWGDVIEIDEPERFLVPPQSLVPPVIV
ncbi:MAG: sulfatase-like hydrolase/transferase [Treponema sp.]|nr:sulfatase-like hydrolase/transferase [Treponema sp.]